MARNHLSTNFEVITTPPPPRQRSLLTGLVFLECVAAFCAVFTIVMVIITY